MFFGKDRRARRYGTAAILCGLGSTADAFAAHHLHEFAALRRVAYLDLGGDPTTDEEDRT